MTASAQPSATPTDTSHTVPCGATEVTEASRCSPIRASAPRPASSRVSGPASSGAHSAAGVASRSASRAANRATWAREAPRARSSRVSAARSEVSSRATSSSAHPASRASWRTTTSSVVRETNRERSTRSSVAGSSPAAVAEPCRAGAEGSAATPSFMAVRSASIRSVVIPEKSAEASQPTGPALTRPPVSTAGSASSGP
ncbi:hypothetical protein MRQ88_17175 [Streptomyces sp. MMS20-AI2-20]|nr:hypothetical protein [Streptomyces sp. MMS20-AI2-20]